MTPSGAPPAATSSATPSPGQANGSTQPDGSAQANGSAQAGGSVDASGTADAGATQPPPAPAPSDAPADSFLERLWARIVNGAANSLQAVREEFRSIVTIRRVDQADHLLLSPEQKRLARDNLKLLLLNARLDLINRHEALFRKDIERVIQSMQGLFDMDSQEVRTAVATLQSLQSQPLAVELPSLSESLGAVKAARAASEKRS